MTPRLSVRAAAREHYMSMSEKGALDLLAAGRVAPGAGIKRRDLMSRVRALYERSAVPVREIARLAGITERTLYKYAAKGRWKQRYIGKPRRAAAVHANHGRRWRRAEGHAPVKGAGGRFIARADANKPVVHGIKATDPAGRARAEAACDVAARRSAAAQSEADREQRMEQRLQALHLLNTELGSYERWRKTRLPQPPDTVNDQKIDALYRTRISDAVAQLDRLRER